MARRVSLPRGGHARPSMPRNMALMAAVLAGSLLAPAASHATTYSWNNTAATWATAADWSPSGGPPGSGDLAVFDLTSYTQPSTGTTATIGAIQIGDGTTATGALTISGTALTINGISGSGITMYANSGAATISASTITLGASQSWINNSASLLTVSGAIACAGYTLTIDGTGRTLLSQAISGTTATFIKNGAGELDITGNYTAGSVITTTLDNGVLFATGNNHVPTNMTFNGGMLIQTGFTNNNYTTTQTWTVASGGGIINVNQSATSAIAYFGQTGTNTATFGGGLSGAPVTLFKSGIGTYTISNGTYVYNALYANMGVYGGTFTFDSSTTHVTGQISSADIVGGILNYYTVSTSAPNGGDLAGTFMASVSSSGSSIGGIYLVGTGQVATSLVGTGSTGGALILSALPTSFPNMTTLGNGLMWLGGNQTITTLQGLNPDSDGTYRLLGNNIGAGVLSGSNNVIIGAGPNTFNGNPTQNVQIVSAQTFSGTLTVAGNNLGGQTLSSGKALAEIMNSGATVGSILNVTAINIGPNATLEIYNNGSTTGPAAAALNSNATMTLTDGRLQLYPNNGATTGMSESVATLNVNGVSSIYYDAPSSAPSDQLSVGNLVINRGGFLTINIQNGTFGSATGSLFATNLNSSPIGTGFVTPAIRVSGSEFGGTFNWVKYTGSGAGQGFQPFATGDYTPNPVPTTLLLTGAENADYTTANATVAMTGSGYLQTIRFSAATTINVGTGNTLTVTSGGIACNGSNGTFGGSISTGGYLTTTASALYLNVGGNTINVNSQLTGNFDLVITNGSGSVNLYNTANNFVGNVYLEVTGNITTPSNDHVFGDPGNQIFVNSATFTAGSGWTTSRTFNVMAGGVMFNQNTTNTSITITLNGQVTGSGPIVVGKAGNGSPQILILGNPTPNSNNFTGTVYLPYLSNYTIPSTIRTASPYVLGNNAAYSTGGGTLIDLTNNGAYAQGFSQSMGSLEGSGNVTLGTSAVLTIGGGGASGVFEGVMTGGSSAGLTKTGTGTLSLTANQLYGGATTITGGTLRLLSTGAAYNSPQMHGNIAPSSSITVGDTLADNTAVLDVSAFNTTGTAFTVGATTAQTLSGFGTIKGNTIIGALATMAPGSAGNTGILSITGNATLTAGAILNYNFNTPGDSTGNNAISSSLAVTGSLNLTANGLTNDVLNITMVGNPTLTPGSYRLATAAGGITSNVSGWTINGTPAGYNSSVTVSGSYLLLNFTAALAPITWTGTSGPPSAATWDFATTNWTPTAGGGAVLYQDTAPVTFDDSGTNTAGIVIAAGGVQPLSVLFANTGHAYSFAAGGGPIAGSAGVTVSGGGTVTFYNANTYAGGTAISNASTLVVGNSSALRRGRQNCQHHQRRRPGSGDGRRGQRLQHVRERNRDHFLGCPRPQQPWHRLHARHPVDWRQSSQHRRRQQCDQRHRGGGLRHHDPQRCAYVQYHQPRRRRHHAAHPGCRQHERRGQYDHPDRQRQRGPRWRHHQRQRRLDPRLQLHRLRYRERRQFIHRPHLHPERQARPRPLNLVAHRHAGQLRLRDDRRHPRPSREEPPGRRPHFRHQQRHPGHRQQQHFQRIHFDHHRHHRQHLRRHHSRHAPFGQQDPHAYPQLRNADALRF